MAQTYTNQHVCKERIERKKDIKPENGWFSVVYKGRRARETRRRRRRRRFRFRPFLDILVRYYTSPCFLCAIITTLVKNKKNARKNLTDLSFFFPPPPPFTSFTRRDVIISVGETRATKFNFCFPNNTRTIYAQTERGKRPVTLSINKNTEKNYTIRPPTRRIVTPTLPLRAARVRKRRRRGVQ